MDPKIKTPDTDIEIDTEADAPQPMTYTEIPQYVPYPYDADIIGGYNESGE